MSIQDANAQNSCVPFQANINLAIMLGYTKPAIAARVNAYETGTEKFSSLHCLCRNAARAFLGNNGVE